MREKKLLYWMEEWEKAIRIKNEGWGERKSYYNGWEESVSYIIMDEEREEVHIEKKTSLYLLCDGYVLSIADGTSVSTLLCTRKLEPEEVSVNLIAV